MPGLTYIPKQYTTYTGSLHIKPSMIIFKVIYKACIAFLRLTTQCISDIRDTLGKGHLSLIYPTIPYIRSSM